VANAEILYSVKAQRGDTLRCKGWKQETILRMLENNMENAEIPELLVIYGGNGKCARNWESYHAIVKSLKELEDNETLVVQSGMPVAIFKTHKLAPRVVMATTNIMKATWEVFYDLQDKNLTMFASILRRRGNISAHRALSRAPLRPCPPLRSNASTTTSAAKSI
jgi:urocanate hydratase